MSIIAKLSSECQGVIMLLRILAHVCDIADNVCKNNKENVDITSNPRVGSTGKPEHTYS